MTGKIKLHHKQFAFIEKTNIYIHRNDLQNVFDQDVVEYKIVNRQVFNKWSGKYENQQSGKIIRVIKRHKENFVVEVIKNSGKVVCKFDDKKIIDYVLVHKAPKVNMGDKLFVKMSNFDKQNLQATFIKNLGHKDDLNVDITSILYNLEIKTEFSSEIKKEVQSLVLNKDSKIDAKKFTDLRQDAFITIDPTDAKDFDDAIAITKHNNGYKLLVAISDVWSYLQHCPQTEEEANERGSSVYILESVIPMIPFELSTDLCSLVEGKDRNVIVAEFLISMDGDVKWDQIKVFPAIIQSKKRLNYDEVNHYLEHKTLNVDSAVKEVIDNAFDLYQILEEKRTQKGYLKIERDVYKFNLDDSNEISDIYLYKSGHSQKLIEVFMVLANIAVAKKFKSHKLPAIYRYHESPKIEKIRQFLENAKELNFYVDQFDINNFQVGLVNKWLEKNKNHPNSDMIKTMILQSMQQAVYTTENSSHFGLNLKDYLHFTSPIRRLPDLIVHKLLWMKFFDTKSYSETEIKETINNLDQLARQATASEIKNSTAENTINKLKIFKYLIRSKSLKFKGVVVARHKYGFSVRIDNIYEIFTKTNETLRLGDNVLVEIIPDIQEGQLIRRL